MRAVLLASALVIALGSSGCNTAKRLLAEVMKKGDETVSSEPPPAEATDSAPSEALPAETAAAVATDPVPAEPAPAVTVEAANVADVTRFDDEKKLDGTLEERTTELPAEVELRRAPDDGELVAKLVKGASVERLTERGEQVLVLAADPAQADRKLLGWLPKSAVETPAPADSSSPSAPTAVAPVPQPSAPKAIPSAPKAAPSAPKTTPKPPPTTPPKASTPKPVTPPTPPKSTAPDESGPKKKKKKKKGETLD